MEILLFAIADFLCQHGSLELKTSLGRRWERKYNLLVPSDSECRGPTALRSYLCSQYYVQNVSVLLCLIMCRCAPAILMSQLMEHKPAAIWKKFFFFTLLQPKKLGYLSSYSKGALGLQLVCLPLSWHVGRARVVTAYACGAVLDTGHLHKIVSLGDEASEYFKADVQFLGKIVS